MDKEKRFKSFCDGMNAYDKEINGYLLGPVEIILSILFLVILMGR